MAPQQSRGGTFEVGQVAAGNELFVLTGSPRQVQEEQDTPAHPQAVRRRGRAEGTSMKESISLNQTCKWVGLGFLVFFACVCMFLCEVLLHSVLKLKCSAHAYAPTFCALSHSNAKEQQRYITGLEPSMPAAPHPPAQETMTKAV